MTPRSCDAPTTLRPVSISVCMAAYNGERYLREQLASILSQLGERDELVLVDDASTDLTPQILEEALRHPRVRMHRAISNQGPIASFEKAIGMATNNIIVLSDQDDVWAPTKLDVTRRAFDADPDLVALLTNAEYLVDGAPTGRLLFPPGRAPRLGVWQQYVHNDFAGCCLAFHRRLLELALPFPRFISMHDWWLGTVALLEGRVSYRDSCEVLYRRHLNNASPGMRRPMWRVALGRVGNMLALARVAGRILLTRSRPHGSRATP